VYTFDANACEIFRLGTTDIVAQTTNEISKRKLLFVSNRIELELCRKLMYDFISQMKEYILKSNRNLLFKVRLNPWVRLKAQHTFLSSRLLAGEFFLIFFAAKQATFLPISIFGLQLRISTTEL